MYVHLHVHTYIQTNHIKGKRMVSKSTQTLRGVLYQSVINTKFNFFFFFNSNDTLLQTHKSTSPRSGLELSGLLYQTVHTAIFRIPPVTWYPQHLGTSHVTFQVTWGYSCLTITISSGTILGPPQLLESSRVCPCTAVWWQKRDGDRDTGRARATP